MSEDIERNIFIGLIVAVLIFIVLCIVSVVLMFCWNYIMPVIFGLPQITFWQAFVMHIMSTILFRTVTYHKGNND